MLPGATWKGDPGRVECWALLSLTWRPEGELQPAPGESALLGLFDLGRPWCTPPSGYSQGQLQGPYASGPRAGVIHEQRSMAFFQGRCSHTSGSLVRVRCTSRRISTPILTSSMRSVSIGFSVQ